MLNRRTVIAGIAGGVPAAAVGATPALASTRGEVSFPDLAARWNRIYLRWRDWSNASRSAAARAKAREFAETGLSDDDAPKPGEAGWEEWREVSMRIFNDEHAYDPVNEDGESIAWAEIHDEIWPLAETILEQPATTIADLSFQAQALAYTAAHCWTSKLGSLTE